MQDLVVAPECVGEGGQARGVGDQDRFLALKTVIPAAKSVGGEVVREKSIPAG